MVLPAVSAGLCRRGSALDPHARALWLCRAVDRRGRPSGVIVYAGLGVGVDAGPPKMS